MIQIYRADTEYAKRLAIAFVESFVILFLFLLFFPKIRDVVSKDLVIPPEQPATLTIDLSRTTPEIPPPNEARLQQPQFMSTNPAQESPEAPKDPKFFSALNTVAASTSPGQQNNNNPNQEGEKTPALGFANQRQSAALNGSGIPQQAQQPTPPAQQTPAQQQQKASPAQPQTQSQQKAAPQPDAAQKENPQKNPVKAQENKNASPNQIKSTEAPPRNPPADIKQAAQNAAPKPVTPALMSSESQNAELVKANDPPKLRPDHVADTETVAAPDAAQKDPRVMNLNDVSLSDLAALTPRQNTPPPSPLANPAAQASSPSSAPSNFEQRTAIEGGQTAVIRSMTSFDTRATPLGRYIQYVLNKIKYRWLQLVSDPTKTGLLKVGTVHAKFDLMADGTVRNIQLISDSNDVIFTGLCRDAIWYPGAQYNPFPPEVAAALGEKKEFEISFALY